MKQQPTPGAGCCSGGRYRAPVMAVSFHRGMLHGEVIVAGRLVLVLEDLPVELVGQSVDRGVHVRFDRLDMDVLAARVQVERMQLRERSGMPATSVATRRRERSVWSGCSVFLVVVVVDCCCWPCCVRFALTVCCCCVFLLCAFAVAFALFACVVCLKSC